MKSLKNEKNICFYSSDDALGIYHGTEYKKSGGDGGEGLRRREADACRDD